MLFTVARTKTEICITFAFSRQTKNKIFMEILPFHNNAVFLRSVYGQVAQLVEQRTENPRVGGSIPSLTTQIRAAH